MYNNLSLLCLWCEHLNVWNWDEDVQHVIVLVPFTCQLTCWPDSVSPLDVFFHFLIMYLEQLQIWFDGSGSRTRTELNYGRFSLFLEKSHAWKGSAEKDWGVRAKNKNGTRVIGCNSGVRRTRQMWEGRKCRRLRRGWCFPPGKQNFFTHRHSLSLWGMRFR